MAGQPPLDDFNFSFDVAGYNLDTPKESSASKTSPHTPPNPETQWATGGQSNAMMPSKGGELDGGIGLGSKLVQRRNNSILRQSIEGLNNMSIESNGFGGSKATMPPRNVPPSLALGGASQQFLFDSTLGQILSPAAEQLAKISMLFKSGNISSGQRSQMKDHLYLSLSQDSLL